jgi:hypothetical protein
VNFCEDCGAEVEPGFFLCDYCANAGVHPLDDHRDYYSEGEEEEKEYGMESDLWDSMNS